MSRQLWQLNKKLLIKTTTVQEKQAKLDELKEKNKKQESKENESKNRKTIL